MLCSIWVSGFASIFSMPTAIIFSAQISELQATISRCQDQARSIELSCSESLRKMSLDVKAMEIEKADMEHKMERAVKEAKQSRKEVNGHDDLAEKNACIPPITRLPLTGDHFRSQYVNLDKKYLI